MSDRLRALVIYKKSNYQRYVQERRNRRIARLVAEGDKTVEKLKHAHQAHQNTVERTRALLEEMGVRASFRYLATHKKTSEGYDLVITLGGDGTLLWASHMVTEDRPMVAINTAPGSSVGYFCAGDSNNLEQVLSDACDGRLRKTMLTRMTVELEGRVLSRRVLNDVLFCHEVPAATTRYLIRYGNLEEDHKSSGIWIGPAAGSTAAQRSAGGRVLPIRSERLQWVVREPYTPDPKGYELPKGLVEPGEELRVRSKIDAGRIYIDGPHRVHRVPFGTELCMTRSDQPLMLLGLKRGRR